MYAIANRILKPGHSWRLMERAYPNLDKAMIYARTYQFNDKSREWRVIFIGDADLWNTVP